MNGLAVIAEAVLRVEHKVDLIVKAVVPQGFRQMMHFTGHTCPVCNHTVDYQVDLAHNVVARVCNCKTGKVAPTTPLLPMNGEKNG